MKYRKIPKIKPSDKSLLQMQAPGGLYSEIALKFKNLQWHKNVCICQRSSKNYYVCQMIAVKKCHSILMFA